MKNHLFLFCEMAALYLMSSVVYAAANSHPLDPLSAKEIESAAACVKTYPGFPNGALFPMIVLKEPPKEEIKNYVPKASFRREAFVVVLDRNANKTFETVCDLRLKKIIQWKEIPDVQPLVLVEEYNAVPEIVKKDPQWQKAMEKRGIKDFSQVQVDTWAAGTLVPKEFQGKRLLKAISYIKGKDMNFYGRPIEGVLALVDMNLKKVVELIDSGNVPIPEKSEQFDQKSQSPVRRDLKPLHITQPKGVSFSVDGNEIRWQKWRFRYALHPREGLVLYTVGYEDTLKLRTILYRGAVSEMVVPYGDVDPNWSWRNAFDAGEYGVGRLAAPLEKNTDAPENAKFFDAAFSDDFGKAYVAKKVVAIYERDGGMLWKHYDIYSNTSQTRRGRELVLLFVAAIGNYDYAFKWIFSQDGGIRLEADLTGIMLPKGVAAKSLGEHDHHVLQAGHLVAPNVACPHHQHFFNFRLDFDVDGVKNSLEEFNTMALEKGKNNPENNGIKMEATLFKTEKEAARDVSVEQARKWRVFNPELTNSLGYHPGYLLIPEDNSFAYAGVDSAVRKRAAFIDHQFWTSRYHSEEIHAAGTYPNQNPKGAGIKEWISDDESIEGQDVVLWYTMGITHVPRPEEWPIMPTAHLGFKMLPTGFFTKNPALDLP